MEIYQSFFKKIKLYHLDFNPLALADLLLDKSRYFVEQSNSFDWPTFEELKLSDNHSSTVLFYKYLFYKYATMNKSAKNYASNVEKAYDNFNTIFETSIEDINSFPASFELYYILSKDQLENMITLKNLQKNEDHYMTYISVCETIIDETSIYLLIF